MVHFQILNGKKAGTAAVARRFPFRIGRAVSADLCLDEAGVWDEHIEIQLRPDRAMEAVVPAPALASINGQPISQAVLRNGDIIELGSVRLRFTLSPVRQRSLRLRETLTWITLAILSLGQVALIYWLG